MSARQVMDQTRDLARDLISETDRVIEAMSRMRRAAVAVYKAVDAARAVSGESAPHKAKRRRSARS